MSFIFHYYVCAVFSPFLQFLVFQMLHISFCALYMHLKFDRYICGEGVIQSSRFLKRFIYIFKKSCNNLTELFSGTKLSTQKHRFRDIGNSFASEDFRRALEKADLQTQELRVTRFRKYEDCLRWSNMECQKNQGNWRPEDTLQ